MDDLYKVEQKVFDEAVSYSEELKNGAALDPDKFTELVKEYGILLRQLRMQTRIPDRMMRNLHKSKADLLDQVYYDSLTGIYNRRYLEEAFKRIVKVIARANSYLSVMMGDIDFFKNYNDTYGHSAGDVCLKAVAEAIVGCLSRSEDFAARYGGEEFAVILPNTDENGARIMADRILEAVRKLDIPHKKNEAASCVTISIGLTTGKVAHTHEDEDYLKRADMALYQSKQNGRNRYTYISFGGEQP